MWHLCFYLYFYLSIARFVIAVLCCNIPAHAAEAGDHLVKDEKDVVLGANLLDPEVMQ